MIFLPISRFKCFYIFIFFFNITFVNAQSFFPEINNFTIENYQADNQNWGIDIDENGVVFIANNKGLLRYNGQKWDLFELPKKTIIRSVLCDKDKIYSGSYEEFGFWKKNSFGNYEYTSLTHLLNSERKIKNEQFWQILKYGSNIVFRSYAGGIYIYNGEKITYVNDSNDIHDITIYKGELVVGSRVKGLLEYKNGRLTPAKNFNKHQSFNSVNNVVCFENQLFVYDLIKGGFLYKSNKINPLPNEINSILERDVLNKVVFLDENQMAFGTIKNGLVLYNLKTQDIRYVNKENSLNNNTVLGLNYINGNLWLALDNGIGKVDFESPFLYYKDFSGTLGSVYDVAFYDDKYYLGSNTGLYSVNYQNKLELIKNSEGHIWDLSILNNELFCGHNNGVFQVKEDRAIPVDLTSGGVYGFTKIPQKESWYLQGTYIGISRLLYDGKNWNVKRIDNIPSLVSNIVFESQFVIWASHPYKGIYRIRLDEDYTKALEVSYYQNSSYFKQYKTIIRKYKENVLFYNSYKWFKYNKEKDSIEVFKDFKKLDNKSLLCEENNGSWIKDNSNSLVYINDEYEEILKVNAPEINKRLVSDFEKIIKKDDSVRIINLNDGFVIFDINTLKKRKDRSVLPPVVERIYSKNKNFLLDESELEIPFNDAKFISFEIYSPKSYGSNHSYILSGKTKQKENIKQGKFILQNLRYGKYELELCKGEIGLEKEVTAKISFVVLPPWYLSNLMQIIYVLVFLGGVYTIYKVNKIKIRRDQLELQRKYIKETQKKIGQLEKKNLKKEVENKKQELISSTSSIISKNEVIMVLTNELERLKDVSLNKNRTEKVLDSTKKHFNNNNEDWKQFESNFNQLNGNFFKYLIESYPKLSTKDLKLCAYIKTGLTSKEIAPLMGITLRGVELHRYRLRKKLNLNSTDNLSNFLRVF